MKKNVLLATIFLAACVTAFKSDEKLVEDICKLEIECGPELESGETYDTEEECIDYETRYLIDEGWDCYEKQRDFLECRSQLKNCQELNDYWEEPTEDYPCHEEEDAYSRVIAACTTNKDDTGN